MGVSRSKDLRRNHRLARRGPTRHVLALNEAEPPLLADLREALAEPGPLGLLAQASGLLEVFAPERRRPDLDAMPPRAELLASFLEVDTREVTALLTAWHALTVDRRERRLIASELQRRRHALPAWLTALGEVRAARVAVVADAFRDVEQFLVELRWPSGEVLTLTAMVDANLGNALIEGAAFPATVDEIAAVALREGLAVVDVDPASARSRAERGIELTDLMEPPIESDSWPMARPLLEWGLRLLPSAAVAPGTGGFDEAQADRILADFLESDYARGLGPDAASLADKLCWFADYNCGDPLRWSPQKVVQLLGSTWWVRKVHADRAYSEQLPTVLDAFVRFAGERKGLSRDAVEEIRTAIDLLRPEFLASLDGIGAGPVGLLTGLGAGLFSDWDDLDGLDLLADRVGGVEALDALDTEPLADEAFAWDGVEEDIRPRLEAVLDVLDPRAEALFGYEFRTACRRLLAHVAVADPGIFRRRGSEVTAALAVAFLVGQINDLVGVAGGMTGKALAESFGQKSMPTSRVDTFKSAARYAGWVTRLGTVSHVSLLTSDGRRRLIERRDWWRARSPESGSEPA